MHGLLNRNSQPPESRPPLENGFRRAQRYVATYVLAFLLASAASPHRHKNDVSDLLTDGPSDSDVFLDVSLAGPRGSSPLAESVRWIDDDPCFACFLHDFTFGATETADALPPPFPILGTRAVVRSFDRRTILRFPISRGPPPASVSAT